MAQRKRKRSRPGPGAGRQERFRVAERRAEASSRDTSVGGGAIPDPDAAAATDTGTDAGASPDAGATTGSARNQAAGPAAGTSAGGWRFEPPMSRSERRNAQVRAGLKPLEPGERPAPILISAALAAVVGLGNLIAFAAGLKIGGKHPSAIGVVLFSVLMIFCAFGLWRLWYQAVLGFMALLAIIVTVFALLLIEASNLLGVIVALAVILGTGFLFYKLVRVLSRIQIPPYPGRGPRT